MQTPLSELTKRIDTKVLYPPFFKKIEQLLLACQARGMDYYLISGLRTPEEQAKLYAQGRTTPGNRVTNARPFESFHNLGIAIDACPDKDMSRAGLQPDWNESAYKILGEEAVKLGLTWGGNFKNLKDFPHVELNLSKIKMSLPGLAELYKKGGFLLVFSSIDKNLDK